MISAINVGRGAVFAFRFPDGFKSSGGGIGREQEGSGSKAQEVPGAEGKLSTSETSLKSDDIKGLPFLLLDFLFSFFLAEPSEFASLGEECLLGEVSIFCWRIERILYKKEVYVMIQVF